MYIGRVKKRDVHTYTDRTVLVGIMEELFVDEYVYCCEVGAIPGLVMAGGRVVTNGVLADGCYLIVADGDVFEVKGSMRLWARW